jgi:zinc/manganese transport system substrate-binding protein
LLLKQHLFRSKNRTCALFSFLYIANDLQLETRRTFCIAVVAAIAVTFFCLGCNRAPGAARTTNKLEIVAAENFWGSLVAQLGGEHVDVVYIVSDPNADPHEFASSAATARVFANADYVIVNGAGYDSWGDKLLNADNNPQRKVLDVADLLGKKAGDNPHFWYSPTYVNQVVEKMKDDLIALDPKNAADYRQQYEALQSSLAQYQNRITSIRSQFKGTKVAATEDIFTYLAEAAGLDLISPRAFMAAVGEGNDPPVQSIIDFQNQIKGKEPAVLVYNQQTVTPLTEGMKKMANGEGIPVVGITETVQPPDATFQEWMDAELISLENALNAKALGK